MNKQSQPEDEIEVDIRSVLSSLASNRFWPFAEGVYLLDEIKPWAAAAYTFIVICLDTKNAIDDYDTAVVRCDQQFSTTFCTMARNMLTTFPRYIFTHKGFSVEVQSKGVEIVSGSEYSFC